MQFLYEKINQFADRTPHPEFIAYGIKHKIYSEKEIEHILLNLGEDRPGRDGSRIAIGQTQSGRFLRVIYVPDVKPESAFVITAYELRGKPLQAYRRRMRRRRT